MVSHVVSKSHEVHSSPDKIHSNSTVNDVSPRAASRLVLTFHSSHVVNSFDVNSILCLTFGLIILATCTSRWSNIWYFIHIDDSVWPLYLHPPAMTTQRLVAPYFTTDVNPAITFFCCWEFWGCYWQHLWKCHLSLEYSPWNATHRFNFNCFLKGGCLK